MVFYKNYSFEYNAKAVDIFKSIVVCSYSSEADQFKEGSPLDLEDANFYGIVTESKNTGERLNIEIVAESYARELRNNNITTQVSYRYENAITIIQDNLLPDGWTFEYPATFDESPLYISYILRNGNYISHITTILQMLGLDFTIFTTKAGGAYTKVVKAYFRDDFSDRPVTYVTQWQEIGNLSVSVDYGKVATSIIIMGAESEQGNNQTVMDAEMGDWTLAPHIYEIKDTKVRIPEFNDGKKYLWVVPAMKTNYLLNLFAAGDKISVNEETMVVKEVYFLSGEVSSAFERGEIDEDGVSAALESISNYSSTGVIVVEVDKDAAVWIESLEKAVSLSDTRNVGSYQTASPDGYNTHTICDDVFSLSCKIMDSPYFSFPENLPSTIGFVWLGSERVFYRAASQVSEVYLLENMVRGVPTCAIPECEHCGTRDALKPLGWNKGCPFGGTDTKLSTYCTVASAIETSISGETVENCPLCFDAESPCPITKCPFIMNDVQFSEVCPKGLLRSEVSWTSKYIHRKNAIVFPDQYYEDGQYLEYASDSLIAKYGYIPTQIQVKGVADLDGLDKVGEGILRLSALPISGKFSLFNFDPWTVPDGYFPGDVLDVKVASHGRYDLSVASWFPTQWYDYTTVASVASPEDYWVNAGDGWYKIRQKFVIQKTCKNQRGLPEIYFGTDITDFQSIMDYLQDIKDTTSQRHRNQEQVTVVASSETGAAARVKNNKTGQLSWVGVVR